MAASSISESKRVRYLLGLSSPAEREHIEAEFFRNDDAFEEMLTAEDDLIDAYARGELMGEERRRFEKNFGASLRGRDRVQFARAFATDISNTRSRQTKFPSTLLDLFRTVRSAGVLRTALSAAAIVLMAVLVWLMIDRRRMTDELSELHAQSSVLSNRIEALQQSRDIEQTQTADTAGKVADRQRQVHKPRRRERGTTATERVRRLPEVKNNREKFETMKAGPGEPLIKTSNASLGNNSQPQKIIQLPLSDRNIANLLSLQPAVTPGGSVAAGRSDQANVTLDGVDVNLLNTQAYLRRSMSSSGGPTIRGTAKDPQGNVVSGATVTLTQPARNFILTQSTNNKGVYVFNGVPPGIYSIEVSAPGFKTASASGLTALVDTPTVRDVQLEVGAISETVDVSSAAEAINTNDATLGNSFEPKRLTELPLKARNVEGLLSLQPGVRPMNVNGRRADQSNVTLDGVDTTVHIPAFLSWIRFHIALKTSAIHENYSVTIKTVHGRPVTSVDWIEPLTPNQTLIDTPAISTGDLRSGDYVLLLMGKERDGSFVTVAQYSFEVIKY